MPTITAQPEREFIDVIQAARECGVHPRTIRHWIQQGKLTAYRVGNGRFRIDRRDLATTFRPVAPRDKAL